MKKILFLDIDGVLVTWRSHYAHTPKPKDDKFSEGLMTEYDRTAAAFLRKFCLTYGLYIVVSSTWRKEPPRCKLLLMKCGLARFLHKDWCTADNGGSRGDQIQEWLSSHKDEMEEGDYLVLDDQNDLLPSQQNNLIACNEDDGLGMSGMSTMINWARGKADKV